MRSMTQSELLFRRIALDLGINLDDIEWKALMAVNGGTFMRMAERLDDKLMKDGKSGIRIYDGSYALKPEFFVTLCSDFFQVPDYHIEMMIRNYEKMRGGKK